MTNARLAAAWLCLGVAGYHYLGWIITAFLAFCVYWALWKPDPDSPFALIAWPVWYGTGFGAVAVLLHSAIYLEPWGLAAALVLIEFYALPMHRRSYTAWAERYNEGARQIAADDFASADRSAEAACEAAQRIRWSGQEARAASALMRAQTRLKLGDAPAAETLAGQACPEFERHPQIHGVTADGVYRIRGVARLTNRNPMGALEDLLAAVRLRAEWAGEDRTVAETMLLASVAQSQLGDTKATMETLLRAQRIAASIPDENLEALIRASLGSGRNALQPGAGTADLQAAAQHFAAHGVEALVDQPRAAYLVLVQLGIDGKFDQAWRLWNQLWQAGAGKRWLLFTRGQVLAGQGLYRSAKQAAERALALTEPLGDGDDLAWCLTLMAGIEFNLGNTGEARRLAVRADQMLERAGQLLVRQNRALTRVVIEACDKGEQPDPISAELAALDASMMLPGE